MRFLVKRTSRIYGDESSPCEGAKLLNPQRDTWEEPQWGIELETIDDLLDFYRKQKHPVIIGKPFDESDYSDVELEIYDDYRE